MPAVSIIIPAFNAEATIGRALAAICDPLVAGVEVIVIDDGSTDATSSICEQYPVKLLRLETNRGPAYARNAGARLAAAELLLFLDADTCLEAGGMARITAAFEADPALDGLIGAYDDHPAAPGMLSQYRNLLHCFIHRNARRQASTFWSACGAIRSAVFFEQGGFDESYRRASIEDLEFGYRLKHAGKKIIMHPEIQVKHLKHWTLSSMLRTDIRDRAIPWTQLILRERFMPADLNLGMVQRLSVAMLFASLSLCAALIVANAGQRHTEIIAAAAATLLTVTLLINWRFYAFLYERCGLLFTARAIPLHLLFYFYSGVSFLLGFVCWMFKSDAVRELRRVS